jgi:hypothetical protein
VRKLDHSGYGLLPERQWPHWDALRYWKLAVTLYFGKTILYFS